MSATKSEWMNCIVVSVVFAGDPEPREIVSKGERHKRTLNIRLRESPQRKRADSLKLAKTPHDEGRARTSTNVAAPTSWIAGQHRAQGGAKFYNRPHWLLLG